jgi:hypothetical protein
LTPLACVKDHWTESMLNNIVCGSLTRAFAIARLGHHLTHFNNFVLLDEPLGNWPCGNCPPRLFGKPGTSRQTAHEQDASNGETCDFTATLARLHAANANEQTLGNARQAALSRVVPSGAPLRCQALKAKVLWSFVGWRSAESRRPARFQPGVPHLGCQRKRKVERSAYAENGAQVAN